MVQAICDKHISGIYVKSHMEYVNVECERGMWNHMEYVNVVCERGMWNMSEVGERHVNDEEGSWTHDIVGVNDNVIPLSQARRRKNIDYNVY